MKKPVSFQKIIADGIMDHTESTPVDDYPIIIPEKLNTKFIYYFKQTFWQG